MTDEIDTMFPAMTIDPATGEVMESIPSRPAGTPVSEPAASDLPERIAFYENYAAMIDVLRVEMQEAKDAVIPGEIKADIEAIEAEFAPRIEASVKRLEAMKKELQAAGVKAGLTVNGDVYQVQYVKGSWTITDLPGLLKLAVALPLILNCISEGKPSARVTVRRGAK